MQGFINAMHAIAASPAVSGASARHGKVTGYDPNTYRVKVSLQPEGSETGWIPYQSAWVGNGWGMFTPPPLDTQVMVDFQEGDPSAPIARMALFDDQHRPVACPAGELWLVHQSGASFKLANDGTMTAVDPSGTILKLTNDGNVTITGNLIVSGNQTVQGNTTTNGTTTSQGQIVGQGGMAVSGGSGASVSGNMSVSGGSVSVAGGDVAADGISLKSHKHSGVQSGSGTTGGPQ